MNANYANGYIEWSYFIYLGISLAVTVWVARTLHQRGRIFLVDSFQGNTELADSINHLLVVGFYLINIGFVGLALRSESILANLRQAIEMLSTKLGWVLLILGGMHFFNIYVFSRFRNRVLPRSNPPLPPSMRVAPPPPPPPTPVRPMGGPGTGTPSAPSTPSGTGITPGGISSPIREHLR